MTPGNAMSERQAMADAAFLDALATQGLISDREVDAILTRLISVHSPTCTALSWRARLDKHRD